MGTTITKKTADSSIEELNLLNSKANVYQNTAKGYNIIGISIEINSAAVATLKKSGSFKINPSNKQAKVNAKPESEICFLSSLL